MVPPVAEAPPRPRMGGGNSAQHREAMPPPTGQLHHWVVWQMLDSLYPTGGFAHSLGLEAAVQEGVVRANDDGASLREFLHSTVFQAGNFALPIVFSSFYVAAQPNADTANADADADLVEKFLALNARATALYSNHVAKKASFAQGAALLRLAISTYHDTPSDAFDVLVAIRKESKKRKHVGVHHAVVFGVVCGRLGTDADTCQRMYLFFVLRDALSAATRLNLIGPMEAARIQYEFAPTLDHVVEKKKNRTIESSYSSAPMLDLVQAMHDQLYTRIFNS